MDAIRHETMMRQVLQCARSYEVGADSDNIFCS